MFEEPSSSAGGTCPVCATHIQTRDVSCPRCETFYHAECLRWAGGCSIYGCIPADAAGEGSPGAGFPAAPQPTDLYLEGQMRLRLQDSVSLLVLAAVLISPAAFVIATFCSSHSSQPGFDQLRNMTLGVAWLIGLSRLGARWVFDPAERRVEIQTRFLGLPIFWTRVPFDQIARIEVQDHDARYGLIFHLRDHSSFVAYQSSGDPPFDHHRLEQVALGLRRQTRLVVTSSLKLDICLLEKQLARLQDSIRRSFGAMLALAIIFGLAAAYGTLSVIERAWYTSWGLNELMFLCFLPLCGIAWGLDIIGDAMRVSPAHLHPADLLRAEEKLRGKFPGAPAIVGAAVAAPVLAGAVRNAAVSSGLPMLGMFVQLWLIVLASQSASWLLLSSRLLSARMELPRAPAEEHAYQLEAAVRQIQDTVQQQRAFAYWSHLTQRAGVLVESLELRDRLPRNALVAGLSAAGTFVYFRIMWHGFAMGHFRSLPDPLMIAAMLMILIFVCPALSCGLKSIAGLGQVLFGRPRRELEAELEQLRQEILEMEDIEE